MLGLIKKGKNTLRHGEWLRDKGYTVMDAGEAFVIEVTSMVEPGTNEEPGLDLSIDPIGFLFELVVTKRALTYATKVRVRAVDGSIKVLSGVALCCALERITRGSSALVMKPL